MSKRQPTSQTRDSTWADIYDRVYAYLTEDIFFYVEQAVASGGPVLELGCGTGRVSVPVAQAGMSVVGIDVSPSMIKVARSKARTAGVSDHCIFRFGDMREIRLGQRFPLVIMPFRSFQDMLSIADQQATLNRVRRHLTPGGRLVFDIWAPDVHTLADDGTAPSHFRDVSDPITGHTLSLWHQNGWDHQHQINNARLIVDEMDADGVLVHRLHHSFQMRYSFRYEMQHLLTTCGFRVLEVYGGFQRHDPEEDSEGMVWVVEAT